jgi:3-ketoacyl-CoA synthase
MSFAGNLSSMFFHDLYVDDATAQGPTILVEEKHGHAPESFLHCCMAAAAVAFLIVLAMMLLFRRLSTAGRSKIYCVESSVFVPPASWRFTHEQQKAIARAQGCYNEESLSLSYRTLDKSAIGDSAHMPPAFHPSADGETKAIFNMATSREEAEAVMFPIVQEVLEKSGLAPRDIDFLIVNCSLFVPTPSLCAMICNKFRFKEDLRSYNLGGMGCSANVISVDLAKQLLQNQPGARALVVSTEIITPNLYVGNDKSMLVQNTLFRAGGAALVLSSNPKDASRAKYELVFAGRAQVSDDASYGAVFQHEDSEGHRGVALSKEIVKVAGRAMAAQFKQLGRRILPFSEQAKVGFNLLQATIVKRAQQAGLTDVKPPAPYVPDFSKAVQHFCIHAGGRAIIDGVQKNLGLTDKQIEASRQTLHDWGNTSSSSIWYEMEWLERFGNMRRGDKTLQITFGSGFKCNSAVWRVLRVDQTKRSVPIKPPATQE